MPANNIRRGELIIELWPSLEEIKFSKREHAYLRRLTEFYKSAEELLSRFETEKIPYHRPTLAEGAWPPEIIEFATWIGPGGIGVASLIGLHKLLRVWVDLVNGRRYRVRIGGLEVEATQISQKRFVRLCELLLSLKSQQQKTDTDLLEVLEAQAAMLKGEGFSARLPEDIETDKEIMKIKQIARDESLDEPEKGD